jgi:hypothetical protein
MRALRALAGLARPTTAEVATVNGVELPAELERTNRIVVYGTRLTGSLALARELEAFLSEHGIQDPSVDAVRDVGNIQRGFYGLLAENRVPNLPLGVVALQAMRQYDDLSGNSMPVPTPFETIQALCERYDVPMEQREGHVLMGPNAAGAVGGHPSVGALPTGSA